MFPVDTLIKDFAYSDKNPLRYGQFKHLPGSDEEEDEMEYDYYNDYENDPELEDIEVNQRAIALFDFTPENDNEVALSEGQVILISYRHGQGWLVAEDPETGENGLVPEEYVEIMYEEETPKPFLPKMLGEMVEEEEESEWVDTDEENRVEEMVGDVNKMAI